MPYWRRTDNADSAPDATRTVAIDQMQTALGLSEQAGLIIRSDNRDRYPDEDVPTEGKDHIAVIGRVVWRAGEV